MDLQGMITASVFLGMMVGGWAWGLTADKSGRKKALVAALLLNSAFGFMSAFSQTYGEFLAARLLSGLGY